MITIDNIRPYLQKGLPVTLLLPGTENPAPYPEIKTEEEAKQILRNGGAKCNIGIRTGKETGLLVVKLYTGQDLAFLAQNEYRHVPVSKLGECQQVWYKFPENDRLSRSEDLPPRIEICGDGAHIIAPPSILSTGERCKWAIGQSITDVQRVDPPEILFAKKQVHSKSLKASSASRSHSGTAVHKAPAFQFYPGDWLSSTRIALMSPAEEGAYIRLLCHAWAEPECSLPNNDDALAMLSRLGEAWFKGSGDKIKGCFTLVRDRFVNERLKAEKEKQKEWREKSRLGGINSGKSRKDKELQPKGGSEMVGTKDEPKGNSSFSSSSSNKKEIYKEAEFSEFWNVYPHRNGIKAGKAATEKAIQKTLNPEEIPLLIQAAKNYAQSPDVQKGIGIKDPQRFVWSARDKSAPWRDWIKVERQRAWNEA